MTASATTDLSLPLARIPVLELSSGYAAGLAGRLLRGYGAHVTRIAAGPGSLTADERTYLHSGKPEAGADRLRSLLDDAAIVVSDLTPTVLASLGIDWPAEHATRPDRVVVSVTPFGLVGPYADRPHSSATAFALGGIMGLTGDASRSPLVTGGNQAYALAGINAFSAAVTMWLGRARHGRGDLADISGQDCAAGMLEYYGPFSSYTGDPMVRLGNQTRASWGVYPCLDGWGGVFALERQIPPLFRLLDDEELTEPRFADPLLRLAPESNDELNAKIFVWFADKTKDDLRRLSLETRVPFGIVRTPKELLSSDHLQVRGALDPVGPDGAVAPGRPFPGFGWRGPSTPDTVATEVPPARPATEQPRLPLTGVRVLDLTMMWAGPFATLRLAEMGADVIKIESPSAWDNIRTLISQPGVEDPWNSSFYFNAYNRDKRSLTIDLAQQAGRDLLLRLVADADVLIENYRADVLDKLGLPVDLLLQTNPRLVVVSMAAFGKDGPDRDHVGFGPVIEMMSGLASLSGYGDGEPFKTGISYGDPVAGVLAAGAVSLGLLERERTGLGRHIDLAQLETSMVLIGEAFVAASRGEEPVHHGCRDARHAPQGCYPTTGDDSWIVVTAMDDTQWSALCDVIGLDPDEPLRSADLAARRAAHDRIDELIVTWTARQEPQAAMEALHAAGVAAGRVLTTLALLDDPNLVARSYWVDLPHPKMHAYRQQGVSWPLRDGQPWPRRHCPLFGEHNDEILRGELGLGDADIAALRDAAVIADQPINPGVG